MSDSDLFSDDELRRHRKNQQDGPKPKSGDEPLWTDEDEERYSNECMCAFHNGDRSPPEPEARKRHYAALNASKANEHSAASELDDLMGESGAEDTAADAPDESTAKPTNNHDSSVPAGELMALDSVVEHADPAFPYGPADIESRNLYDFGPFSDLAKKISEHLPALDATDPLASNLSNLYLSQARESLHHVVMARPAILEPGSIGLSARLDAMQAFVGRMSSFHDSLTANLDNDQKRNFLIKNEKYMTLLQSLADAESTKIQTALQRPPPNLIDLLAHAAKSLVNGKKNEGLRGRLREQREIEVTDNLNSLQGHVRDMATRVGDEAWEAGEGQALAKKAKENMERTRKLMEEFVDQTDEKGFLKRFGAISKNFEELSKKAVHGGFKASLADLVDRMKNFVGSIFQKLGLRQPVASPASSTPEAEAPRKSSGPKPSGA